jgi:hypothetical protein
VKVHTRRLRESLELFYKFIEVKQERRKLKVGPMPVVKARAIWIYLIENLVVGERREVKHVAPRVLQGQSAANITKVRERR